MKRRVQKWAVAALVAMAVSCQEAPTPSSGPARDSAAIWQKVFTPPEQCQPCHPDHYREWAMSMHAYAVVDPVFHSMNALGQQQTGGRLGQFCIACHSPAATLLNEAPDGIIRKPLSPHSRGGVTCVTCHAAVEQVPGHGITRFRFDGVMSGTVLDPLPNDFHGSVYDRRFGQSEVCAGCHDVINPRGFRVEETFTEWKNSLYPARDLPCQACHMKWVREPIVPGGPIRRRHTHVMEGVDVPLTPHFPGREETIALIQYALENALIVTIESPLVASRRQPLVVLVNLFNQTVGHNIPSGTIFERQMWVEFIATNERGDTLYASGLLDPNGDLRTTGSEYVERGLLPRDTALALFNGTAFRHGRPIEFFFDADAVLNRTIPPFESRIARYTLLPATLRDAQEVRLNVRVLFRPFPPYFLRKLGHHDLVSRVPIFTMKTVTETVRLQD
ncbi:MAG: multiheme c-type cytochrome [Bacteroidota bacterium]|nr:multiheme c-type cytochrome [Bacteroidota bacterium]MDW8272510.1 multiheme c-type cytochrome [Bacteroidota bacterium]